MSGGINLSFSTHALHRMQQRGIKSDIVEFVFFNADKWLHQGAGCESARISKRLATKLRQTGVSANLIERAKNVVLLISHDEPMVITVMHLLSSKKSNRYQRQYETRQH